MAGTGWAECAAQLLNVDTKLLIRAFTTRTMKIRGQADMDVPLKIHEANGARDAVAKFIYAHLFDWLVQKINTAMGSQKNPIQLVFFSFGTHWPCDCRWCQGQEQKYWMPGYLRVRDFQIQLV